ncbi:MAG: hypothetical protein LBD68_09805 [Zoogloeaceae bacterium]|nr:hypothetical protein [Zoogloeaceae bacterium]
MKYNFEEILCLVVLLALVFGFLALWYSTSLITALAGVAILVFGIFISKGIEASMEILIWLFRR